MFNDHARIDVALAQHEAERLNVPFIGDDTLLIGVAQAVSRPEMRAGGHGSGSCCSRSPSVFSRNFFQWIWTLRIFGLLGLFGPGYLEFNYSL